MSTDDDDAGGKADFQRTQRTQRRIEGGCELVRVDGAGGLKAFVGKEIGVSDWLTVTQERIQQFAEATEDRQWIHTDQARAAKESPYGATIAHGFLTLSLISALARQVLEIGGMRLAVNYGLNRVRFPSAVRAGSRIRGHVQLMSVKDVEGGGEATFVFVVEAEGGEKPCCIAEWIVRYYV